MPLLLLPTFAVAAGSALALASVGADTSARRAEARRVVLLFAWFVLLPLALFPALVAPGWSLAGLLDAEGGATAVLVVLSAAGATLAVPAYELCASDRGSPAEGTRALLVTAGALLATGLLLYLAADRLAAVPVASAARAFAPPVPLGDSSLPPLLGVLLPLGGVGFALSYRALRALAHQPPAHVEPRRTPPPR
jgi:hypothetical protein